MEDGTEYEQTFTIHIRNIFAPLVETMEDVMDNELGGQVLADGGGRILSQGVQISEYLFIWQGGAGYLEAEKPGPRGRFHVQARDLRPGQTYYYQAFATNSEGTGYGFLHKFVAPKLEIPGPWRHLKQIPGTDWYDSGFGHVYLLDDSHWFYHIHLGWIYTESTSSQDLWVWIEDSGWHWTARQYYPYIYRDSLPGWIYLIKSIDGTPVFYNTVSGQVEYGSGP